MKILVTGANGYLGQGIVKSILDRGVEVVAADFKCNHIDPRAQSISCNLFEIEKPYEYFGVPDVLLHLAWRDGFVHNSDAHLADLPKHYSFIKAMMGGTVDKAAAKTSEKGSGIKRVAVMGSMHEIGFFEGSINENTPCHPMSMYGIGKNALRDAVELLVKQYNIPYQWLRGYYIVGNSEYGSSIFSKITAAEKDGKTEFPFTLGQNQYDFLDYTDFCNQVATTVTQDAITGIINIGSGKPEKLADRVERFIKENGYKIKLKYGAFPDRPYDSKAVWGDGRKIQQIMENAGEK